MDMDSAPTTATAAALRSVYEALRSSTPPHCRKYDMLAYLQGCSGLCDYLLARDSNAELRAILPLLPQHLGAPAPDRAPWRLFALNFVEVLVHCGYWAQAGGAQRDAGARGEVLQALSHWRVFSHTPVPLLQGGLWSLSSLALAPARGSLALYAAPAQTNMLLIAQELGQHPTPVEAELGDLVLSCAHLLESLLLSVGAQAMGAALRPAPGLPASHRVEHAWDSWPVLLLRLLLHPTLASPRLALCRFPFCAAGAGAGALPSPLNFLDVLMPVLSALRHAPEHCAAVLRLVDMDSPHCQLRTLCRLLTSTHTETACAGVCAAGAILLSANCALIAGLAPPQAAAAATAPAASASAAAPLQSPRWGIEGLCEEAARRVEEQLGSLQQLPTRKPFDALLCVLRCGALAHPHVPVRRAYFKCLRHVVDVLHYSLGGGLFMATGEAQGGSACAGKASPASRVLAILAPLLPPPRWPLPQGSASASASSAAAEGNPTVLAECLSTWLYARRFLCSVEDKITALEGVREGLARDLVGQLRAIPSGAAAGAGEAPALLLATLLRSIVNSAWEREWHLKSLSLAPSAWQPGCTAVTALFLASELRDCREAAKEALRLATDAVEGLREEGQGRYSALQGLAVALGQQVLQCQGEEAGRELRGGLSAGLKAMFQ